jgi:hypothetical protein
MSVLWERDGDAFYGTTRTLDGGTLFHLIAEQVNHHWDWSVWRPDQPPEMARHGVADTAQEAMQAAEEAVI